MNSKDIFIKLDNFKFNFRVAALIQYNDKVLLQKSEKDSFYGLIGGKVQQREKTFNALKREVKEELNFDINKEKCKLSRLCENFFVYNSIEYHELLFIYYIKLDDTDNIEKSKNFVCNDKKTTMMCWIDVKDLKNIDLRPKEAKQMVNDTELKHIIINK